MKVICTNSAYMADLRVIMKEHNHKLLVMDFSFISASIIELAFIPQN